MMTREWCFGLSCLAPRAWDQLLESDGFLFKNPIYKCTLCIAQSNRRTMSKLTRAYCVVSSSELNHNHNISIFKNTPPVYKNTIQNLKNPPIIHVNVNVVLLLKYFLLQTYEKRQICSMHCILCITMQVCIMQESKLLQNSAFVLCDSVSDSCIHCIHTIDNDFANVSFSRTNRHSIFPQFELNFIVSLDF